ncbi:MAG: DTW domain-containing protein [Planctomycetota bacterium]
MSRLSIDPAEYHRENRCPGCRLTKTLCICDELPRVEIPFELVLIQHAQERASLSNTGSLAARVLQPSVVAGYRGAGEKKHADVLQPPGLLLYPLPGAETLGPQHLEGCKRLVVLDAGWRQSRRMFRKLSPLRALKSVTLPPVASRWVLRKPPAPGMLNTVESIAAALAALGLQGAAAELDRVIDDFMPRALHIARKIRYDDIDESQST